MQVRPLFNRIYADYFMRNRFREYRLLMKSFLNGGYRFFKINEAFKIPSDCEKFVFIRHDVDSEPRIMRQMFEIEKELGIKSTYYFRLSTFDINFAKELIKFDCEVGYHYEEIADYVKNNKVVIRDAIINSLDEIRELFIKNIQNLEKAMNYKILTVASHGDWINRHFKMPNLSLITQDLMAKAGLLTEAYDIERDLEFRIADRPYPHFWCPCSPYNVIDENRKTGLILIHPRQWTSNPPARLRLDFQRFYEYLKSRLSRENF